MVLMDEKGMVAAAKNEGREEGEKNKQLEIARKMKSRGYPVADIAEDTGLTKADIEKL